MPIVSLCIVISLPSLCYTILSLFVMISLPYYTTVSHNHRCVNGEVMFCVVCAYTYVCVCAHVCVCVCVRACVHACVRVLPCVLHCVMV